MSNSGTQTNAKSSKAAKNPLASRRRIRERMDKQTRASIVAALREPGAVVRNVAARFNVGVATVYTLRLNYVGRKQFRMNTPPTALNECKALKVLPACTPAPRKAQEVSYADEGVTLTKQECRMLATIVREAVKKMDDADELAAGRLALLALKLAG